MGKGPDQGDFETTTADETDPTQWPTEPDIAPGTETTPPQAPATTLDGDPGPEPAMTTGTAIPPETNVDYLPTTSGPEAAVASIAGVAALAVIGTGIVLAWKRTRKSHW